MHQNSELAIEALGATKAGWRRYHGILWVINFSLCIDCLTGRQFLTDEANIKFLNLSVPRIAFSITYSILFGTFIVWAIISTQTARQIICSESDDSVRDAIVNSSIYRLWWLSPINTFMFARYSFWFLAGSGLFLLFIVTIIHLFGFNIPHDNIMTAEIYRGIGVACATILIMSIYASVKWIIPDWICIHHRLLKHANTSSYAK